MRQEIELLWMQDRIRQLLDDEKQQKEDSDVVFQFLMI